MSCLRLVVSLAFFLVLIGCSGDDPAVGPLEPEALSKLAAGASAPGVGVIPLDAAPHGLTYAQWSSRSWQWMATAPLDHSPGLDETGADLAYGQSGKVWFLLPNFTGGVTSRTGTVPAGTMLFISLVAFETSSREGYGETEAELRAAAASVIDLVTDLSCEVDGIPVQGLSSFRFASDGMFSLTVPEDNIFDLWGVETPAGTYYPSVADGYYLMLAPLSAGEHTIHWHGAISEIGYFPDITYHLTVLGGSPRAHPQS